MRGGILFDGFCPSIRINEACRVWALPEEISKSFSNKEIRELLGHLVGKYFGAGERLRKCL